MTGAAQHSPAYTFYEATPLEEKSPRQDDEHHTGITLPVLRNPHHHGSYWLRL